MVGPVGEFETVLTISGESDVAIGSHGSRWMGPRSTACKLPQAVR